MPVAAEEAEVEPDAQQAQRRPAARTALPGVGSAAEFQSGRARLVVVEGARNAAARLRTAARGEPRQEAPRAQSDTSEAKRRPVLRDALAPGRRLFALRRQAVPGKLGALRLKIRSRSGWAPAPLVSIPRRQPWDRECTPLAAAFWEQPFPKCGPSAPERWSETGRTNRESHRIEPRTGNNQRHAARKP